MEVRDRVVVVTGGASGLGLACIERLRADGARCVAIDADAAAVTRLQARGIAGRACDVAVADALESVFVDIRQQHGAVAVLINCAGVPTPGTVVRRGVPMPLEEFRRVIAINLLGTINAIRCAAAQMIESFEADRDAAEHGVIINTSSIAATEGQVGQAAYAASKGGVSSMVLPLARELGEFGIRVNAIAPGVFETPMTSGLPEKSRRIVFAAVPPSPRRPGRATEFAGLAAHLIAQPYLNGAVLRLDGGLRMPARI